MTETAIAEALLDHLKTIGLSPDLPIAWPLKSFTPPAEGGYLRANVLRGTPTQAAMGEDGFNRHVGFLQVDVVWPLSEGAKQPLLIADVVAGHYKRGTGLDAGGFVVQINRPPSILPTAKEGDAWCATPVRIFYLADAPNQA